MFKLVYCVARKADVAAAEFYRYWHDEHAPRMKARRGVLRARRYVQSHTVQPELNRLLQDSRGMQPPYDGITEVWWDSVDDLEAALATAEGRQAMQDLLDDERHFVDLAASRLFCTEEKPIF